MDDNSLDDLIRRKLDNYEDPVFDPAALTSMRERLVNLRPMPWYTHSASRLFVGASLLLFTLINAYLIETIARNTISIHTPPLAGLREKIIIDSLYRIITTTRNELDHAHQKSPSSGQIHVIRYQDPVFSEIDSDSETSTGYRINVGAAVDVPVKAMERLSKLGLLTVEDGRAYVMLYRRHDSANHGMDMDRTMRQLPLNAATPPHPTFVLLRNIETEEPTVTSVNKPITVSLSTQKALEKHYFRGIGIEVAPHIDAVKGIFTNGSGSITPRIGVAADWILSPSISIETGFDYLTIINKLDQNTILLQDHHSYQQFGSPTSVNLTYSLGSMPIAIKYRQWISSKNQALLKVGVTPYATFRKEFQYSYQYNDNGPDHDLATVTTLDRRNDLRYYGATMTGALGITSLRAKNKSKFETSLFYERSFARNRERQSMQLVGLRAAYWLKVK